MQGSATAVSQDGSPPLGASADQWHNGFTVGAGVAVKATRRLSFGVEYNYVDIGAQSYDLTGCGSCTVNDRPDVDHKFHVVKATINLHLNGN